jgi:Tol biopolymer transport system component
MKPALRLLIPCLGIAALILGAGAPLVAATEDTTPLIDRDVFFGDPKISGAQISPDGKWISFRQPYRDVMNIWVKKADEPFDAAKPMTADTERPVTGYFWSEDSRYLLYVQDKGGNENFHVFAVDPRRRAREGNRRAAGAKPHGLRRRACHDLCGSREDAGPHHRGSERPGSRPA